jgi:iron complex outermembrane receptor protein
MQGKTKELGEAVVVARKGMNEKFNSMSKMPIDPMDLPQSTVVIGKSILERQQVLHLSDVLQNTTGIYVMGTTGGYQEEIAGRGYPFTSSNTFKNGARYNNSIMPELSSVERIEFLKGGNAILFGNVAAGGVLNIVTRKPKFERGGDLSFRLGSNEFYKTALDLYGPLDAKKKIAYRFNSSYEKAGSFREHVNSGRFYINPSFLIKIGKKTEVLVESDYLDDERTPDFGIGSINYTISDVPRNRFLGVYWGYNKASQVTATSTITHKLKANWQLKAVLSGQQFRSALFGASRPSTIQTDGSWIRGLQKSKAKENYYMGELDLAGSIKTGFMMHKLLIGIDGDTYQTTSYTFQTTTYNNALANQTIRNKNIYDTINIFGPSTFNNRKDIPDLAIDRITKSPIQRVGVYMQDLIALAEKWKILAGLRYSYQNNKASTIDSVSKKTRGIIPGYQNDAISPRLGIVFQPVDNASLYFSYTNSFSVNAGVDINNQPLSPSIIDQLEAGCKTELWAKRIAANLTVYKIVNSDFAQAVLNPPATVPAARELAGEVTSKGIEFDISCKPIKGFSFMAGYSYNDTRYTRSNLYKKNDRLRYNPASTANAACNYSFGEACALKGLSLGAGAYYVGKRLAGRNTTVSNPNYKLISLPDYILVDLVAGYSRSVYTIRIKLANLFNVLSYNVHDDNSVNPISPTQFSMSLSVKL